MLLHRRSRRRSKLVLLRSSVAPKPQSRALPPEETISSDNETRLKQSEGRIALGSVLTKCSPWAFAPPKLPPSGVDLVRTILRQRKAAPAAFFLFQK